MIRTFAWTERRDALLRELRRQGLSLQETARAIGCEVEHVRVRAKAIGATPAKRAAPQDVAAVPRPVRRPSHLIDLSRAPSAMEQRFAKQGDA